MRKYQNTSETGDLLDELLGGMEEVALLEEQETIEEKKEEKKKTKEEKKEESKFNTEEFPLILERIDAGLIGTLPIGDDKSNKPILKKGDLAQLRKPNRLLIRDFVLYKIEESYFLRRIIKFKGDDIYVAGDHEHEYHVIHKENIVAKVVGRERGKHYLSFSFNPKNKFYTFRKVNLACFRLGNRIKTYEQEQNQESFENAMANFENIQAKEQIQEIPQEIAADIDLESDLAVFLDPDDLVRELREEAKQKEPEEEIVYVDEFGNEIEYNGEDEIVDESNQGKFVKGSNEEDEEEFDEEDGLFTEQEGEPLDTDDDVLGKTSLEDEDE